MDLKNVLGQNIVKYRSQKRKVSALWTVQKDNAYLHTMYRR